MDPRLLFQFQSQVLLQCDFLLLAADDLIAILNDRKAPRAPGLTDIFSHAQSIVTAAANISKALWGQGGSKSHARLDLRQSIGISDSSPLRTVTMRNHYEHFDDRLEEWLKKSTRHNVADVIVAPNPKQTFQGFDDIDWFRALDDGTLELHFWGDKFDLKAIIDEVKQILPTLRAIVLKGPQWANLLPTTE